jgi:hypothetical protein
MDETRTSDDLSRLYSGDFVVMPKSLYLIQFGVMLGIAVFGTAFAAGVWLRSKWDER